MTLSIIVAIFNVESYLRQCLDSIFDGTADKTQFEVILVNDGSQDGASLILEDYRQRFGNCIVIEQENQGLSATRMNGLAQARGEYIWFVDGDDWLEPNAVDSVFKLIHDHHGFSVFVMPIRKYDELNESFVVDYLIDHPIVSDGWDLLRSHFPAWYVSRYVISKSMFDHPSLFFPMGLLHEDAYFGPVLLALAGTKYVSNLPLYHYRSRPGSISHTITIRSSFDLVSIYTLLQTFAKTLEKPKQRVFLEFSQFILNLSYKINESIWGTLAFRRFMQRKTPYLISELFRNFHCYSFKDWVGMLLLFVNPTLYRKIFPAKQPS